MDNQSLRRKITEDYGFVLTKAYKITATLRTPRTLLITAHALKLVQQYGQLNAVTIIISVDIFDTMDIKTLY